MTKDKRNTQEKGITLIETIVSLAIVSIVAVVFLTGMSTNYRGKMVQDKGAFGEAIASSQMEYIKKQPFSTNEYSYYVSISGRIATQQPSWWDWNDPPLLDSEYAGYRSVVNAVNFDADGDGTIEVPGDDDLIRQITVEVYNAEFEIVTELVSYKTGR